MLYIKYRFTPKYENSDYNFSCLTLDMRNYTRFDVFNTPTEILPECHSSSFVENKYFRPFKPQITLHNLDVESDIMFIPTTSLCLLNLFATMRFAVQILHLVSHERIL